VDWFALAPTIARANGIGVSHRAPHAQAARLFYEYSLTDAQPLLVKFHYVSPRRSRRQQCRSRALRGRL